MSETAVCIGQTKEHQADSLQLLQIAQKLVDAIAVGDTSLWILYLDDRCMSVIEDGSRVTKKETIQSLKPLPTGYSGNIKVTNPKIVFNGNTAVLSYVADEHEEIFGQKLHTFYSEMDTYIKTGDNWKIISTQTFEIPAQSPPVILDSNTMKPYCGIYQLSKDITYSVSLVNDTLIGQRTGHAKEKLIPIDNYTFYRQGATRGVKIFVKDSTGNVIEMVDRRNGQDLVWKKVQ